MRMGRSDSLARSDASDMLEFHFTRDTIRLPFLAVERSFPNTKTTEYPIQYVFHVYGSDQGVECPGRLLNMVGSEDRVAGLL